MDAITFGILSGVTDMMVAGQTAEDKAEAEAAKLKADQMKTGMTNFVNLAAGDPVIARSVLSNPGMVSLYQGLNAYDQASIFASASKAPMFNEDQKSILGQIKDRPGAARSLLNDNRVLDKYSNQPAFMAILSSQAGQMSQEHREIIKDVGGDINKAKPLIAMYEHQQLTNTPVYHYLKAIKAPDKPYTAIKNEVYTQVGNLLDKSPAEGLVMIGQLSAGIPTDTTDTNATIDQIRLSGLKSSYVAGVAAKDENYLLNFMKSQIAGINELDDIGARRGTAGKIVSQVNALQNLQNKNYKVDTQEEIAAMNTLVQISSTLDAVTKNRAVYTNTAGEEVLAIETDETLVKAPLDWLTRLNYETEADLALAFRTMSPDMKQTFQKEVTEAIVRDHENNSATKQGGLMAAKAPTVTNYAKRIPSVYAALPFVAKVVHDTLGIPRVGGTVDSQPMLPAQTADDGTTPLDGSQIRFSPTLVLDASQPMVDFATALGTTPAELLNTDEGFYNMVDPTAQDPFKLINAANIMYQNKLFDKARPNMQSAAFILGRLQVHDRDDQLDVVAANMNGDIPKRFKPQGMQASVNATVFESYLQHVTGREINVEDVGKALKNASDFENQLVQAQSLLNRLGTGSRFSDNFTGTLLNLFALEGNLLQTTASGVARLVGRFDMVDFQSDKNVSAAQNRDGVEDQVNSFLDSNFAKANARMASLAVTLAYGYAKTMDPSGRISERDFASALDAVIGNLTDPKEIQKERILGLLEKTRDNRIRQERTFGFVSRFKQGDQFYQPTNDEVRRMKALRHMDGLIKSTMDLDLIEQYQETIAENGFNSPLTTGMYAYIPAIDQFPSGVARAKKIFEVKVKRSSGSPQRIMGGLFVESGTGRIFSTQELQNFRNMGAI